MKRFACRPKRDVRSDVAKQLQSVSAFGPLPESSLAGTRGEHAAEFQQARHEVLCAIQDAREAMAANACRTALAHTATAHVAIGRMQASSYELNEMSEAARLLAELSRLNADLARACVRDQTLQPEDFVHFRDVKPLGAAYEPSVDDLRVTGETVTRYAPVDPEADVSIDDPYAAVDEIIGSSHAARVSSMGPVRPFLLHRDDNFLVFKVPNRTTSQFDDAVDEMSEFIRAGRGVWYQKGSASMANGTLTYKRAPRPEGISGFGELNAIVSDDEDENPFEAHDETGFFNPRDRNYVTDSNPPLYELDPSRFELPAEFRRRMRMYPQVLIRRDDVTGAETRYKLVEANMRKGFIRYDFETPPAPAAPSAAAPRRPVLVRRAAAADLETAVQAALKAERSAEPPKPEVPVVVETSPRAFVRSASAPKTVASKTVAPKTVAPVTPAASFIKKKSKKVEPKADEVVEPFPALPALRSQSVSKREEELVRRAAAIPHVTPEMRAENDAAIEVGEAYEMRNMLNEDALYVIRPPLGLPWSVGETRRSELQLTGRSLTQGYVGVVLPDQLQVTPFTQLKFTHFYARPDLQFEGRLANGLFVRGAVLLEQVRTGANSIPANIMLRGSQTRVALTFRNVTLHQGVIAWVSKLANSGLGEVA